MCSRATDMGWNCPNTKRALRPFYLSSKQPERTNQLPAWPISSQVAIYGDGNQRAPQRLIQEPWVPFLGKRGPNQGTGLPPEREFSQHLPDGVSEIQRVHTACAFVPPCQEIISVGLSTVGILSHHCEPGVQGQVGRVIYLFGSQVSRPWNISRQ